MKSPERLHGRFLRFPDNTLLTVHMVYYLLYYENKLTKNIRPTDILQMYINVLKFTKHSVNDHKFTKYLVNSYHQKGVKHYILTN